MNQCHFLGNLTRDPELRKTQNDKSVVNLGIAVNRRYKKAGQAVNEVAFLNLEAWDTGAEVIAQYFKKGDPIIVHCSVKQDEWEQSDGTKRSALKFRINEFEFVPGNRKNGEANPSQDGETVTSTPDVKTSKSRTKKSEEPVAAGAEEDIPF